MEKTGKSGDDPVEEISSSLVTCKVVSVKGSSSSKEYAMEIFHELVID